MFIRHQWLREQCQRYWESRRNVAKTATSVTCSFHESFSNNRLTVITILSGQISICIFLELPMVTSGAVPLVSPCSEGAPGFLHNQGQSGRCCVKFACWPVFTSPSSRGVRNNLQFGHASVKCILQTAHGISLIYVWLCRRA